LSNHRRRIPSCHRNEIDMSSFVANAVPGVMPKSDASDGPTLMTAGVCESTDDGSTDGSTDASATTMQESVDEIFSTGSPSLLGLDFPFTVANPSLFECPLIACSAGFTKLCGYEVDDIVGQNCRFMVDAVPADMIDQKARNQTQEFCQAVQAGREWMPPSDYPYAATDRPLEELVCIQKNARKDGTIFNNLCYMKVFGLGTELGEEEPYIVALQSELKGEKEDLVALANGLGELDEKMAKVQDELSSIFFVECALSRQLIKPRRQISAF